MFPGALPSRLAPSALLRLHPLGPLFLFLAFCLGASPSPRAATTEHGIRVTVTCAMAQVDQQHRVTVTVKRRNPDGSTTRVTVTQNAPAQSHVQDIADGVAETLTIKCGESGSAAGEGTQRTIDLPNGREVEDVKTEKLVLELRAPR